MCVATATTTRGIVYQVMFTTASDGADVRGIYANLCGVVYC